MQSPMISLNALARQSHENNRFGHRNTGCRTVALVFLVLPLILFFQDARAQDKPSFHTCRAALLHPSSAAPPGTPGLGTPSLSAIDRTRLREAFRLGDRIGDGIWPNWTKAPFAVLLVTPEYEFLIRHPKPSADFTSLGYDAVLKSDVYYRKRNFPSHFLATFPAISGSMISTIVVGQAEKHYCQDNHALGHHSAARTLSSVAGLPT